MSNFTTYFNNLKKIAKNINVDYTKKIYKYTCVVDSCIELKPIYSSPSHHLLHLLRPHVY